jgi:hypothetical protein
MTILFQWLIDYVWIFYLGCVIGVFVYVVRAVTAHRERSLAMFTLERETATSRVVQAWSTVLIFLFIGAAIFISVNFVLPDLVPDIQEGTPMPTVTLDSETPSVDLTASPTLTFSVPTVVSTGDVVSPPTLMPSPTLAATAVPVGAASGDVRVRFGDPAFVELLNYSISSVEITTAQPLELSLTWRALEGQAPTNYVVFTHLRSSSGDIIAQHDGPPSARPMSEWASGEVIVDIHPMAFVPSFRDYAGSAVIVAGLYNPEATGERVLTGSGAEYVTLVTINVVSQ